MNLNFLRNLRPARREVTTSGLVATELGSDLVTHISDEDIAAMAQELGEAGKYSPANGENRKPYLADSIVAASTTEQNVTLLLFHDQMAKHRSRVDELRAVFAVVEAHCLQVITDFEFILIRLRGLDEQAVRDSQPVPNRHRDNKVFTIAVASLALILMSLAETYIIAPRLAGIGVPDTALLGTPVTAQHVATFSFLVGLGAFGKLLARQYYDPADVADASWYVQLRTSVRGHRITLFGTSSLLVSLTVIGAKYLGQHAEDLRTRVTSLQGGKSADQLRELHAAQDQASAAASAASPLAILALFLLSAGIVVAVRALTQLAHRDSPTAAQASAEQYEDVRAQLDDHLEHAAGIVGEYNGTIDQIEALALQGPVALAAQQAAASKQISDFGLQGWASHPEAEAKPLFPFAWPTPQQVAGEQVLSSYVTDKGSATWLVRFERLSMQVILDRLGKLRARDQQRLSRLFDWELEKFALSADSSADEQDESELVDEDEADSEIPAPISIVRDSRRKRRFGAKRLRVIELLEAIPGAETANPYELGTTIAPQVGGHPQTVRGWIREWQDERKAG